MIDPARFIDAGYLIALLDDSDHLHQRAIILSRTIRGRFVTTDAVLTEVGNTFGRPRWRLEAAALIEEILATPTIEVVEVTRELFVRSLAFFASRGDKDWGLTDCISFVVMQDRGITEALAADRHFEQAGFRALLGEP
jgi:predicted nucleic acid-binding protein